MKKKILLSSPHMSGNEQKYIDLAFQGNWIAPLGPNVDGFEKELAEFLQIKNVAALSSGTAGIHLALILLGVQPEDEVICSSFTFSASANPIVYQGATPIFVDSEEQTWNMDPNLLEDALKDRKRLGKKPKAIILVHLYGMPAKIDELLSIANRYEIPVIEDSAESLGSLYNNKATGTFGKFGIFSFNGNKIITTSGGGALVSKDLGFIEKARFLSTQARDDAPHYQHSEIGYNYRMSNICAAIGRGQLEVLNERIIQRRKNFEFYKNLLDRFEVISFLEEEKGFYSNRWITTILIDPTVSDKINKESLRLKLAREDIESRPLWKPMHLQPVFKDAPYFVNGVSEKLFNSGLCLPSGSNLTPIQKQKISDVFNAFFSKF
jgi:dTDP-4-amino-4,6-dideoxygalactose transaminase